jgi:uncharacterized protein (TIGR03435 family)
MRTYEALVGLVIAAAPLWSQARPEFDVASIKPSVPGSRQQLTIQPGGRLSLNSFTLEALIAISHRLAAFQISGAQGWMQADRWAIEAKADEVPGVPAWSPPYLPEIIAVRLRALLEDRFSLTVHHETRELKAYTLTVSKSGSKLTAADAEHSPHPGSMAAGPGVINASAVTMDQIVTYLNRIMDLPVIDKTGVGGFYDIKLRFSPDSTHPLGAPQTDFADPSIFTAMEEQLGLNLRAAKEPVDVLVIDSAMRPTER